jgi:TDG/mug DNA glycosylase family protein
MFRSKEQWRGRTYLSLRDIITRNLDILFVGINPSIASVEEGHYHRGVLGRRFWDTIVRAGILEPRAGYYPDDFMLEEGLGITDLIKRPTRSSRNLEAEDYAEGRKILFQKIVEYKPRIVCAIYKTVFEQLFETRFTNVHGLQENFRIGKSRMFILAPFFHPRNEKEKAAAELCRIRRELRKNPRKKKRM